MKKFYYVYGAFWLLALIIIYYFASTPVLQSKTNELVESLYLKGVVADISDENIYVQILDEEKRIIKTELSEFYFYDDYCNICSFLYSTGKKKSR